jgi:hypothetical protein
LNRLLISAEIQKFIKDHENHDPFALILKHENIFGVSTKEIAMQIQSRQKAKKKLPEWYITDRIYYPPPLSIEQCSSQETAMYKSSFISGRNVIDLTGGMGIDTYYLSKKFESAIFLEKDENLAEIASHNFNILKALNIEVIQGMAEEFVKTIPSADLIYLDPSRRKERKIFLIKDSEPDIHLLMPFLWEKTKDILIKLSPMIDISSAIDELHGVYQVHVVAVGNEVKEILCHLKKGFEGEPLRCAVNMNLNGREVFEFYKSQDLSAEVTYEMPQRFLYEPNASVLKSGAFKILSQSYRIGKLHRNSHLYTSPNLVIGFPGKSFLIEGIMKYDPKQLVREVPKANLVARNFPVPVEKIRAQTRIKEGGDNFLFFTTDYENRKIVIKAIKVDGGKGN